MKKVAAAVLLILLHMSLPAFGSSPAAQKEYTVGYHLTQSSSQSANLKVITEEILKVLKTRYGISSTLILYKNNNEMLAGIKSGKLDFIFTVDPYIFYTAAKTHKYTPFITYTASGKKTWRECFITGKDNPGKTIADFRGKSALTYEFKGEYYLLRSLLGKDPASFFGKLKPSPSGLSMIYALALGEADAVYVSEANLDYLKETNPGPLKKIRIVQCTRPFAPPLLLMSSKTSQNIADNVRVMLMGVTTDKDLKKYGPLFKKMKLSYAPVTAADYKMMFSLFEEYDKKKYNLDYEAWHRKAAN